MQKIKKLIIGLANPDAKSFERFLSFTTLVVLLILLALYTYKKSLFFSSIPTDGAFQHLNPMRRIAAGEVPGVDFQVFHGLVISYLHYPVYWLLGGTLFASEFSRFLINGLCAYLAVAGVLFGLRRTRVALGLFIFFFISTELLGLFRLIDPFGDAYSSLAVRILIPTLLVGYLFYMNRKGRMTPDNTLSVIVFPLVFGTALTQLIATEQGMALFLAVSGALIFFHPGRPRKLIIARDVVVFWVLMPVVYYVMVFVFTHGEPGKALKFYFEELPADQFWYYGAYPNIFPKDFASLLFVPGTHRPLTSYVVVATALLILVTSFVKSQDERYRNECRIWVLGLAYGSVTLVSNLGMISGHYSEAVTRLSCLFLIVWGWRLIDNRFSPKGVAIFKVVSLSLMLMILLFSPFSLSGLFPAGLALFNDYRSSKLEKRYSGVIPRGAEYENFFPVASTVVPPKSMMGGQYNIAQAALEREEGYLVFHNPPRGLVSLLSQGAAIEINGRQESILQVSNGHMVYSASQDSAAYSFKYAGPGISRRALLPIPFYSQKTNIWVNGVASVLFNHGGCMMVSDPADLAPVSEYRAVQFPNEVKTRHVTSVYGNILCVDGAPLEPYVHGFPQRFSVLPYIDFSSLDFALNSRKSIERAIPNVARWLYEAEQNSSSIIESDKNDIRAYKTRYSGGAGYFLRTASALRIKDDTHRYFQRWATAACDAPQRPTLWSTYTGFLELEENVLNPSGMDYIIHALGPTRRARYLSDFAATKPTFVHTLRASYSPYERWIQTATWPFYEAVLANYDPVRTTSYSVLWRRKSDQSVAGSWIDDPAALCQSNYQQWRDVKHNWEGSLVVAPQSRSIELPELAVALSGQQQVYVLEVTYAISNRIQSIPVFGKVARYFIRPIETMTPLPVSLPPYETKVTFPIIVSPGQKPLLKLETVSLFGQSDFIVSSIKYRKVAQDIDAYKKAILDQ